MSIPRTTVRIGVFLPAGAQLLDMACIDVLTTMSHEYLAPLDGMSPPPIVSLAPSVKVFYIGVVKAGELIDLTAGITMQCTHHYSSSEVQPGNLDMVLVPGPDPRSTFEQGALDWLVAHAALKATDILSICTGIYVCGAAGILKGRKACGPRGMQGDLKAKFDGVTWVGDGWRWIQDGNFWSCGGVTNGNDLVAAYARKNPKYWPGPVAEFGVTIAEVGDRPQRYETGQAAFTLGIVWQVIKAAVMSIGRRKQE